jgi:hypothetical protein
MTTSLNKKQRYNPQGLDKKQTTQRPLSPVFPPFSLIIMVILGFCQQLKAALRISFRQAAAFGRGPFRRNNPSDRMDLGDSPVGYLTSLVLNSFNGEVL